MVKFIRLLIVALAFQFVWGTASAYCQHETGKASQHFGHHPHQHQQASTDDDSDDPPSPNKAGADPDCASCAHSPLGVFDFGVSINALVLSNHELAYCLDDQLPPYLGLPERPQWTVAA
jgi:hypothetical protein